jgi:glycine/D-amino acid oxidase-like deaminating enzyme
MALWPDWISRLQRFEPGLVLQGPLLQIAEDQPAQERMEQLAKDRGDLGLSLVSAEQLQPIWPTAHWGGLQSAQDGRINPLTLQKALRQALIEQAVSMVVEPVVQLERRQQDWRLVLDGGRNCLHDIVVICAALASPALLAPLGHDRPMTPVLGQALALEIKDAGSNWTGWPGVLVNQNFNLIPDGPGRMLLGATVEPGDSAATEPLALMRTLNDHAPDWLREAAPIEHWNGLRARPVDRPAPLLEVLEPGLLLATGHHRNGVLLMPATAAWIAAQLDHNLSITKA